MRVKKLCNVALIALGSAAFSASSTAPKIEYFFGVSSSSNGGLAFEYASEKAHFGVGVGIATKSGVKFFPYGYSEPLYNSPLFEAKTRLTDFQSNDIPVTTYSAKWNGKRVELKYKNRLTLAEMDKVAGLAGLEQMIISSKTIDDRLEGFLYDKSPNGVCRFPTYWTSPSNQVVFPDRECASFTGPISFYIDGQAFTSMSATGQDQGNVNSSTRKWDFTIVQWRKNWSKHFVMPISNEKLNAVCADFALYRETDESIKKMDKTYWHVPLFRENTPNLPVATLVNMKTKKITQFRPKLAKSERFLTAVTFVSNRKLLYLVNEGNKTKVKFAFL